MAARALCSLPSSPAQFRLTFSICSSVADSHAAFAYSGKLLIALLITSSLEQNATAGLRSFCIYSQLVAGLPGDNLNLARAAGRMKE